VINFKNDDEIRACAESKSGRFRGETTEAKECNFNVPLNGHRCHRNDQEQRKVKEATEIQTVMGALSANGRRTGT
jgi:hypothetical protein